MVSDPILEDGDDDEEDEEVDDDDDHGDPVVPTHAYSDGDGDYHVTDTRDERGYPDFVISQGELASVRLDQLRYLIQGLFDVFKRDALLLQLRLLVHF